MQSGKKFATKLLPTVFCLLSLLIVACGNTGNNSPTAQITKASEDKQILVRPYPGLADLRTLDPPQTTDLYSAQSEYMIYANLVILGDKGEVVDMLAASHNVSSDGLTWTFTLRDGLKFSDGTPITSQDVVYSIDRSLQPATKSPNASYYMARLKDVDKLVTNKVKTLIGDSLLAPDAKTVKIITDKKVAYFLDALTYQTNFLVEKKMIDKYGSKFTDHLLEGGCSGPWIVSNYVRGKEIDFIPNPNYFGKKPLLKKVVRPFYKEADTTYSAYQVNQLDSATIPTPKLNEAKALPNNQYHKDLALAIGYYTLNYLSKPFDNIKIRQAFDLALDKDAIANNVYKGTVLATNHIVPQGMPGYFPDLKRAGSVTDTKAHPDLAKQLFEQGLKEEGFTRQTMPPIVMTVSTVGSADARNSLAAEQQMWQTALGISIKVDDIDFNKLDEEVTNNAGSSKLMAWSIAWIADYPDPQNFTSIQFGNNAANNKSNYGQNHATDVDLQVATQQLLEQADANTSNPTARLQQYNKAEQQLVDDVAWLPMFQQTTEYVMKPCVTNYMSNAFNLVSPDDWGSIYISTATPCADTTNYNK